MNKKERISIRVTSGRKKNWEQQAKKHESTLTGLITHLMDNCETVFSTSHEKNVMNSMKENHLIHDLLRRTDLSDKAKHIIAKEVEKHV